MIVRFLRFSFTQRKRLRLNGNRASRVMCRAVDQNSAGRQVVAMAGARIWDTLPCLTYLHVVQEIQGTFYESQIDD